MKRLFLALFIVVLFVAPVLAQSDNTVPTPATSDAASIVAVILAVIGSFLTGVVTTLATIAVFVRGIMSNPLWMALAEKIGGVILPKEAARSAKASLVTIGEFAEEIADGIPAAEKPKVKIVTYSDGTIYDPSTGIFTHPDGTQDHDLVLRKSDLQPIPLPATPAPTVVVNNVTTEADDK